jgi:uncharacterized membrane-anchored protein
MTTFFVFYRVIRQSLIAALPQSIEFNAVETLNGAFVEGYLGEETREWQIDRVDSKAEPSSIFVTVPNYDYFFVNGQGDTIEDAPWEARELMSDFDATVHWMVVNNYLFVEGKTYLLLEKCLKTPEIVIPE